METIETFDEDWIKYRDARYPGGIDSEKEKEIKWAFYAGGLIAAKHLSRIPEEQQND